MSKMSKKPPQGFTSVKIKNLDTLLADPEDDIGPFSGEPITHIPDVDVYSTPESLFIEVEMPGVRKDEIEVFLHKGSITIKALKYECFDEDKVNYVCMERVFGRLYRSVEIPFPVDTMRTKALYKNGVLTVEIPRIEDKRSQTKRVEVESG
ncbi:MAG: Hsp20/alpha crystallin family protein [Thermodesulfobacteriota bacterium]